MDFPAHRIAHIADMFPGTELPIVDANNGGSAVAYADTLTKALAFTEKNVDSGQRQRGNDRRGRAGQGREDRRRPCRAPALRPGRRGCRVALTPRRIVRITGRRRR